MIFSRVYTNSNISALTSGSATPFSSRLVDPNELYDLLRKEADLRGGNPNIGNISLSTNNYSDLSSLSSKNSQNTFTTMA